MYTPMIVGIPLPQVDTVTASVLVASQPNQTV
jgi:hypothetical protein